MKTKKTIQSGLSVIAVVTILMFIAILAWVSVSILSVKGFFSGEASNSARAFYIAEAGLSVAKHTLRADWSKLTIASAFPPTSFAGGSFDADVAAGANPDQQAVITVTGTIGESKRRIQCMISRLSKAMTSAVYTNGDFSVGGNASVSGDVTESETSIPSLDTTAAIAQARANMQNGYSGRADGNYFQGDFSPPPSSLNGVMFIDTFPSGSPANVNLSGNISTDDGNPAFLIVMGDLRVTGNVVFHGLIYTTGTTDIDTTLAGNMQLDGALITSGDATLQGNSTVTYNSDMVITDMTSLLLQGEDTPQELFWTELDPSI